MSCLRLTTILAAELAAVFLMLLITSKEKSRSRYILAVFMGIETIHFAIEWFYYNYTDSLFIYCTYLMYCNGILIIPAFAAYVRSITGNKVISKSLVGIGVITLGIIIAYAVLFSWMTPLEKIEYARYSYGDLISPGLKRFPLSFIGVLALYIIIPLEIIVYGFESIRLLLRHKKRLKDHFSYTENISLNWLITIITVFFSLVVLGALMILSSERFAEKLYYISAIPMTFAIGFLGLRQKEIFVADYEAVTESLNAKNTANMVSGTTEKSLCNGSLSLKSEQIAHIMDELDRFFSPDNEKPLYRTKDLTINDVARKICSNKTYISYVIKSVMKKDFRSYVNSFRLEEAKRLLQNKHPKYSAMSIDDILKESGFQSASTFFKLFKETTGTTPDEYRKKNAIDG
jgi:AraC-like DNA-binding protein